MGALRIYLAGPMRGVPEFNHPAFNSAAAQLREAGHEVFNPAEYDRRNGHDFTGRDGTEDLAAIGFNLRRALGADLAWITANADAVVVLPGWEKSAGARAETATATALGLPVYEVGPFLAGGILPVTADPETPLSDALHTLGQVRHLAESMAMSFDWVERDCGERILAIPGVRPPP